MAWPAVLAVGGLALRALPYVGAVRDEIKKLQPTLEDEITVEVSGQPGVTKQQLYFLALAAANGVIQPFASLGIAGNIISHSYGMLMIEYDAADNWVRCVIKYDRGMGSGLAAAPSFSGGAARPSLFDLLAVYRGPQCNVNGGQFAFVSQTLPGIPNNANALSAPKLPFTGQPIVTSCPTTPTPQPTAIIQNPAPDSPLGAVGPTIVSPNPRPPGDNRSRGAIVTPITTSPGVTSQVSTSGSQITNGAAQGGVGLTSGSGVNTKCCNSILQLVPLVFAALSSGGSNSHMTFPDPVQGAGGG